MGLTLKTKSNPADGSPLNPYVAARREWDERYGEIITRAKNWRFIAILCAMATLVAVAGIVTLSARSKVVPFVVAIDSLGRTVSAGPAEVTTTADEKLKKAVLFTWIEDLRLVTTDPFAQRKAIDRVYRPTTDVILSATAQQAVEFSASWRAQQNGAAPGPDGRVLFAFGAGLPTVVCAPLRVCLIELQPGEKLVGEPQIGDSVRWNVAPATFGKGDESTAMLVLKPQMPGLDTNLLITTDRRAYYVRLVSKANDYVSRVAFVYNDDDGGKKWKDHFAEQKREEIAAVRNSVQTQPAVLFSVERLHFDYQIKGGDENIRPQRVFDDGSKTYIQMSPNVANREAPVLMVVGADGKGEVVNYRVKDQMYIVDRLFEHAQLVLGSGKKAQKVEINRDHRG